MTESTMRKALLQQGDTVSIESELKMLNDLIESENRRAKRLTTWTIAVWSGWVLLLGLSLVVYMFLGTPAVEKPDNGVANGQVLSSLTQVIGFVVGLVSMIGIPLLPVAGVILLVLAILARRSANLTQIRCSLAAIDSRLKLLAATQKTPPADSQT